MHRVNQTDLTSTSGNCFQACLASVLERPLEHVPHFMAADQSGDWIHGLDRWLRTQGLFFVEGRLDGPEATLVVPSTSICIISGPSPRYADTLHAVVGSTGSIGEPVLDLLHDPYYPDPIFFDGKPPKWVMFIGRRNILGIGDAPVRRSPVRDSPPEILRDQGEESQSCY